MLPDSLRQHATAASVESFDGDAVSGGNFDHNELTLEIAAAKISSVCGFLKFDQGFARLSTVTAVDRYPAEPRFEVVYHLHSVEHKQRVRFKCRVSGTETGGTEPAIDSVTPVWRGANWYEREVFDLFGIQFRNHPNLKRIMMPDDWEGHPLRKDYPMTGARV